MKKLPYQKCAGMLMAQNLCFVTRVNVNVGDYFQTYMCSCTCTSAAVLIHNNISATALIPNLRVAAKVAIPQPKALTVPASLALTIDHSCRTLPLGPSGVTLV